MLTVMENSTAGSSRLLPEQVWMRLTFRPWSCFAETYRFGLPLVWAHSEYIKLRRSIRDGKIFDQPPQTVQRYLKEKHVRQIFGWRFNNKTRTVPRNKTLRIVLLSPGRVRWSIDDWKTAHDTDARDTGLGIHVLDFRPLPCRQEARRYSLSSGQMRIAGRGRTTRVEVEVRLDPTRVAPSLLPIARPEARDFRR